MSKDKSSDKASPPQLVMLDKALKLAVKWVSDMSKATDDDSAVQLEGRPLGLGLGATVPRQQKVGLVTDPVERKLRANLAMGKRKVDENIEKANVGNDVESSDEDNLDSRSSVFAKKKVIPFHPSSQAKKKHKKK